MAGRMTFSDDGNDHTIDQCYALLAEMTLKLDATMKPPPVADIVVLLSDAPDSSAESCIAVAEWLRSLNPPITVLP